MVQAEKPRNFWQIGAFAWNQPVCLEKCQDLLAFGIRVGVPERVRQVFLEVRRMAPSNTDQGRRIAGLLRYGFRLVPNLRIQLRNGIKVAAAALA